MLAARVAPPLPDDQLPQQLSIQPPAGRGVFEIITPPGGLLVRRLAADLAQLGREMAWVRPLPFEADLSSLTALLLMALAAARRPALAGKEPLVVVESPTSAQAELLLCQLLTPDIPGAFTPSVALITDAPQPACIVPADTTLIEVPSLSPRLARPLVPEQMRRAVPLRQLCLSAGGLAGLIDSALRTMPRLGAAEFARIVTKARGPAALTGALASRMLSGAPADRLAALEMAGHLGYAHPRFRSLEQAVAGSAEDPWWVPLTADWLQVDVAWRAALVAGTAQATDVTRSACLSRLVAELVDEGSVQEAIELCINAGWRGLAADLLAGEAERLLSSGRYGALACWLERLPAEETRGHPGLATLGQELHLAAYLEDSDEAGPRSSPPVPTLSTPARRYWPFRRSGHTEAVLPPLTAGSADLPAAAPLAAVTFLTGPDGGSASLSEEARRGAVAPDSPLSEAAGPPSVHAPRRPVHPIVVTPGSRIGDTMSGGTRTHARGALSQVRVHARLLGPFELHVQGQPVQQWRGNRGRMLLAYLLLHRTRPLGRDALGGVFWPDAPPDVVRNRLHVALYGLRRDLRMLSQHPIVVHSRDGFSFHPGVDLWLDTEAFDKAVCAALTQEGVSQTEIALTSYETALELYRGDLLEDAPFEEWALLDREQLRVRYLETLDRVATMRFELGHYADCITLCQRLAPGDLCREDIHRLLMRCYARLNKPHLAVHQYHQCERQLRDELGLEPMAATRQLYEQIRRRQLV